jgi:hypothetical protein
VHVLPGADEAARMAQIIPAHPPCPAIALGDAPDNTQMPAATNIATIIPNPAGSPPLAPVAALVHVRRAPAPGGLGAGGYAEQSRPCAPLSRLRARRAAPNKDRPKADFRQNGVITALHDVHRRTTRIWRPSRAASPSAAPWRSAWRRSAPRWRISPITSALS